MLTGNILFLDPFGGYTDLLMISHFFGLSCIYSYAYFYFIIFKRTFKIKSVKLFLRDLSPSATFIKYLWHRTEDSDCKQPCVTVLEQESEKISLKVTGLRVQSGGWHQLEGES